MSKNSDTLENSEYNPTFVKEWYYGKFKKSQQWKTSDLKGRKLPDWKHAVAGKIKDYNVIEFPLKKAVKSFSISTRDGSKTLTNAEKIRLAEASISKILFIMKPDGSIIVREIDYIPEWNYLQKMNYDISNTSILKKTNDFTGKIEIKEWSGKKVSESKYISGKRISTGLPQKLQPNNSVITEENCVRCIYERVCEIFQSGDVIFEECGPWIEVSCESVPCDNDPGVGDDPCILFGDCGDPDPDPVECAERTCEEADNMISSITSQDISDISYTGSPETQPDNNGVIRKNKNSKWGFFKLNFVGNYSVTYSAFFHGVIYRNASSNIWKWEEIGYQNTTRAGMLPPCVDIDSEVTCSIPMIAENGLKATVEAGGLSWDFEVEIACLGGLRVNSYTSSNTLAQHFWAN